MSRVVVLGAGISGVAAAYALARSGHEVSVLEGSSRLGGLGGTLREDGFCFDFGPHEFCTENPELVTLLQEVLGDDLVERQKRACQHFQGKFLNYPLTARDVLRLGPRLVLRAGFEIVAARLKSLIWETPDYSFEKWVERRFGKTLNDLYFGPYTRKVWGIDPDSLDPRTAADRISFNSIWDLAIKTFQHVVLHRDDFSTIHSPLKASFYYAKRGIGTIGERMVERCRELDVSFELGEAVEKLHQEGDRIVGIETKGGEVRRDFDYVVNTIPLPVLRRSLGLEEAPAGIRFRGMVFVFLQVPRPQLGPFSWIYFPDPDVVFQRLTDFSHFEADMAPPGWTGVALEIAGFPDDALWQQSDAAIIERARADLDRVGVLAGDVECPARVVRTNNAYPLQTIGYLERVSELLDPIRSLRNLVSIGRQGLYRYCNMNECIEMALDAARSIDAGASEFSYGSDSRWRGAGLEEERTAGRTSDPP